MSWKPERCPACMCRTFADVDGEAAVRCVECKRVYRRDGDSFAFDSAGARGLFAFGDDRWPGLAKLNEECGEVIQIVGKLMMTHGHPNHWSGDLRRMLVEEMADVTAAVDFVGDHCLSSDERAVLLGRAQAKRALFEGWRREQRVEGDVVLTGQGGRA